MICVVQEMLHLNYPVQQPSRTNGLFYKQNRTFLLVSKLSKFVLLPLYQFFADF